MSNLETAQEAAGRIQRGEKTAEQYLNESLANIQAWEPKVHAFLEITEDSARKQAQDVDGAPDKASKVLAGVPIAMKENIATTFGHTRAASHMLEGYVSPFNATVVNRLLDAGSVVVGKANLDEFAMGSSTENSAFGPTKNPWDVERVSGGSSGGSAVAVATGEVFVAIGTDTGGSVRQPASLCGVVGVKPTYGRVSRHGLIAYGSSLDQAGIFTRSVRDSATVLEVIAGHDAYDATSSLEKVANYGAWCGKPINELVVGVPREFFGEGVHEEVSQLVREAISSLKELGATIQEISLPLTPSAIAVYYLIAKAEASSNLARFDGLRYAGQDGTAESLVEHYKKFRGTGFGSEVKRAILMGTYALSSGYVEEWYGKASKVRTLIRREYEEAFKNVNVIVGPVSPEPAFLLGSKTADPLQMYLADAFTVPVSVAGLPAISVPCGMTKANLPVGIQIIAPHFKEEVMFQVASAYEDAHDWKALALSLA